MDILKHPAMQLPRDKEILQQSILQIVSKLREEVLLYLMRGLGITYAQARIIDAISARNGAIERQELKQKAMPGSQDANFNKQLCNLRPKLEALGISLIGMKNLSLEGNTIKVQSLKDEYRKNVQDVCKITRSRTSNLTEDSLPSKIDELQIILNELLEHIRGRPQDDLINSLPLSPTEKIIMGVYDITLKNGYSFVFKQHVEIAMFPPFSPIEADTGTAINQRLSGLHRRLAPKIKHNNVFYLIRIEDPIRLALGYPLSPNARPPSNTSSRATSSLGL